MQFFHFITKFVRQRHLYIVNIYINLVNIYRDIARQKHLYIINVYIDIVRQSYLYIVIIYRSSETEVFIYCYCRDGVLEMSLYSYID